MKVLLVGNGAREHIIAEKLSEDSELYTIMSKKNPAIAQLSKKYWICDIENPTKVADTIKGIEFDLGFASPDATLAAGITDVMASTGMLVASPSKSASRIEWDKGFMRRLTKDHKIPGSPRCEVVGRIEEAARVIKEYGQVAIKPLGLTGGKGVKVSGDHFDTFTQIFIYAEELIKKDGYVLIEEKLIGEEFTLQAFCDGTNISFMPPVQDHKRAFVDDKGPNCYSEDTEILTMEGWKLFRDLTKDDRVMSYDKHWKQLRFEKPRHIYWKKYKGNMILFKNRDVDLLVTPNHRMLLQQRKGRRKFFVIEAQNYSGEQYIHQTGQWKAKEPKYFMLPAYKKHFKFKKMKINFADWTLFLGLYLSEGYVIITKDAGRVYICQTRKSKHYGTMKKILEKLPFNIHTDEKGFRINSIQLATYLKQFGQSNNKFVPNYLKHASKKIIKLFLEAFCLGDGDIHYGKMRFCSSSKRMIGDIQEMIVKLGSNGVIVIDKRKKMRNPINKKHYSARPIYSIEMKARVKTSIRKSHVKSVDYSGYIGCVTVSTGFILVRRNGCVAISGNTGGMGSYSTGNLLPFLLESELADAKTTMRATLRAMKKENAPFTGVLYGQFIATADGIKLIEYNARFGDPEAMNVLSLLNGSLTNTFLSMADGTLGTVDFSNECTVVKYLVPEGYPGKALTDAYVDLDHRKIEDCGAKVYYASIYEDKGKIFTSSSRSLAMLGKESTMEDAENMAEKACNFAKGPLWHRPDIGTTELVEKRISHMRELRGKS